VSVCVSHRTQAPPPPLFFPDAPASIFSPEGETSLPIEITDQNSKYFQLHGKTEKAVYLVRKTFIDLHRKSHYGIPPATTLSPCFSTKERTPLLRNDGIRESVWNYMAGVAHNLQGHALRIGGYYDHAHVLVRIPAKQSGTLDVGLANQTAWQDWSNAISANGSDSPEGTSLLALTAQRNPRHRIESPRPINFNRFTLV
jgi:hypothetical protein